MSKGSRRRPRQISREEEDERWQQTFHRKRSRLQEAYDDMRRRDEDPATTMYRDHARKLVET